MLVVLLAAGAPLIPEPNADAIAGIYACQDTDGAGHRWHFSSENVPFGAWIVAKTSFPAQNGARAQVSQTYVGYDASAKKWHIVALGYGGSFYTRESSSPRLDGSTWVDDDPADGGRAVITLPNANQYVFSFHQRQAHGSVDRQRVVCTRNSRKASSEK